MSFLHSFITAQCFQNLLGLNRTAASISLPRFGCLKGEGDCQQIWQLLTQERGVLGSRRKVLSPRVPQPQWAAQWRAEPWVLEPQCAAGILGSGAGTATGRKHSRRIVCHLSRPGGKEVSSRHSRLKFAADLWDTCPQQLLLLHLLFLCLLPPLLFSCFISFCAWPHAEVHYLEKLN